MQNYNYPYNYQQRTEIIHVNGENGAKALQLAPNSNTLLLDNTAPIVWLVQTDGAGYKTVTPYSITPYQQEEPIDIKNLAERIERLEAKINDKSNTSKNEHKSNDKQSSTSKTND